MRKTPILVAATLAAGIASAITLTVGQASAHTASDTTASRSATYQPTGRLTFVEHAITDTVVDMGPTGDSRGDLLAFANPVLQRRGHEEGRERPRVLCAHCGRKVVGMRVDSAAADWSPCRAGPLFRFSRLSTGDHRRNRNLGAGPRSDGPTRPERPGHRVRLPVPRDQVAPRPPRASRPGHHHARKHCACVPYRTSSPARRPTAQTDGAQS